MQEALIEQPRRPFRRALAALSVSALLSLTASMPAAEATEQNVYHEVVADPSNGYSPEVSASFQASATSNESTGCTPGTITNHGNSGEPWVAITIDDGPGPYSSAIMDAFDANGEHGDATFFNVGIQIQRYPQVAKEEADRGYDIGNHTVTHPSSASAITAELEPNQRIIQAYTGITPVYARAPYLVQGSNINAEMGALGLCNISISLDSGDSRAAVVPEDQVCANIRSAKPDDIILAHDNKYQTLLAFQNCIFPILKEKGLQVVSLHQLLTGVEDIGTRVPAGGRVEIQAGAPFQTVVGQLTAAGELGSGYLTAYPCSEGQPASSDLNYVKNEPVTNLLMVRTDEQGKFCVSANIAAAHIIYDQTAEVPMGTLPLHNAVRKYDSRNGAGKLAAGSVLRLRLASPNQIVIGQIASDQAEQAGYVTAFTCDQPQPPTSNLNYVPGQPTSNRYIAKANENGEICFYTYAQTDLIVDQSAELPPSAFSLYANRLIDTRLSGGALKAEGSLALNLGMPNQTVFVQLAVDRSGGNGYATLYPCDQGPPLASSLNYGSDRPRSSAVIVSTDSKGAICAYSSMGAEVIADDLGNMPFPSHSPRRMLDTRAL